MAKARKKIQKKIVCENLRGSPEAVAKRRAARRLNQMFATPASEIDGRHARTVKRLLAEIGEPAKPVDLMLKISQLLERKAPVDAVRKAVRKKPFAGVTAGSPEFEMIAELQSAYKFSNEIFGVLGLPPSLIEQLA